MLGGPPFRSWNMGTRARHRTRSRRCPRLSDAHADGAPDEHDHASRADDNHVVNPARKGHCSKCESKWLAGLDTLREPADECGSQTTMPAATNRTNAVARCRAYDADGSTGRGV